MMTPEKWTDERIEDRIHELERQLRGVMAVATDVSVHSAQIMGLTDDIQRLTEQQRAAVTESKAMLTKFDETCEKKVTRLETAIAEQGRKVDAQATAKQWTPREKAAMIAPTLASLVTAIALILSQGPK